MAAGPAQGNTFPDAWVADLSVRINRIVADLEDTLFPPVIGLAFGGEVNVGDATAEAPGAGDPAAGAGPGRRRRRLPRGPRK